MTDRNTIRRTTRRAAVLIVLSLGILAGCSFFRQEDTQSKENVPSRPAGPPSMTNPGASTADVVAVTTIQATLSSISKTLEIGGEVVYQKSEADGRA